jgi:hypothetical protein
MPWSPGVQQKTQVRISPQGERAASFTGKKTVSANVETPITDHLVHHLADNITALWRCEIATTPRANEVML